MFYDRVLWWPLVPSAGLYTLSEAWADLMAAQGAFGTDFYDRSTRTIVGTMLWTEYRPVIKIGLKAALGSHEIRPIHSAPSLGQSIVTMYYYYICRDGSVKEDYVFAKSYGIECCSTYSNTN